MNRARDWKGSETPAFTSDKPPPDLFVTATEKIRPCEMAAHGIVRRTRARRATAHGRTLSVPPGEGARDRLEADVDHEVNVRAELAIRQVDERLHTIEQRLFSSIAEQQSSVPRANAA